MRAHPFTAAACPRTSSVSQRAEAHEGSNREPHEQVANVVKWRNHDLQPNRGQGLLSRSCEGNLYGRHVAQS